MASFNRNVSDRDQDPLTGMASRNKLALASLNKLAWPVSTSWHGQSQQAGMASLIKLAWPVSSSWHGQSQQAGMASLIKLAWPALTRESLAGAKNTQTIAGMASSHNNVFFIQGPGSGLAGMASLNGSVCGRSQEQFIVDMANISRSAFNRNKD